ncbi:ABC transporter permease [Staphylococcus intermedius]|uniref:Putative hemin transport system permease protein HrtB n=1 Tax=Staphylococcus intermedius NCTC 11048 TaxID=1141106 RepID=A0A380G6C2_STAIN|nr:FtsX-like permease family protein [Staphylococcus intermedius]PCF63808.1 heme ABC transporter permease [Staphylococcus intermedius]PCF78523.1 heme ABC transporter permease [Staphylococcus intermedius]PCF79496.1 heme ABC transporter permease [Staphylococcus intermedius]PCF86767.1 heme ABC transporter permease [Staphylococcus intermedius]PCF89846.1 heme ABC transporter permease [Staphylococcus intermedius]
MKLALNELKFYKFKYLLITFIVILLASMVLFITGLAQGLARENIALIDQFKSERFVIQNDVDQQLEKSNIDAQTQQEIEKNVKTAPLKLTMATMTHQDNKTDMLFATLPKGERPALKSGHLPQKANEVVLNQKLAGEGVNIGNQVNIEDKNITLKVVGFFDDVMYAHTNIAMTTDDGLKAIAGKHVATSLYFLNDVTSQQMKQIEGISGVEVVNKQDLTDAIPSYQAEQAPLNMMIVSLFVITAIVLTAFFYVMTIQKTSEIGILKAIGIKTAHLLWSLLFQILVVTMLGVIIALLLITGLEAVLPATMPFFINSSMMILVVVVFIIVAIVGAFLSLVRVFKIDPIEAIGGGQV